ncbi:MAG: hypothetical protein KIT57_03610 [Blastocatellales bacterium]|nr:hypothetical protein [Blastocatellales bacterium]
MKQYHGPHKDHHYWMSASEIEATAKPEPTKTVKKTKPRTRSFTMVENGQILSIVMLVSEPVKLDGYQI